MDKKNINIEFTNRSFDLKIENYMNKNLRFSCNKTHNKFDNSKSTLTVKDNDIVIGLRKINESDNWFTIYKQKMVGEVDDD